MAARKAPAKASEKGAGVAKTDRTSTTRGKTFQEVTQEDKSGQSGNSDAPATGEKSEGFYGEAPDDTPNEHYTVDGVLAGKPVPETQIDDDK